MGSVIYVYTTVPYLDSLSNLCPAAEPGEADPPRGECPVAPQVLEAEDSFNTDAALDRE